MQCVKGSGTVPLATLTTFSYITLILPMTISYSYVAPSAPEIVRAENESLKKQVQELTAKSNSL
jgi:hypothetical protein